VLCIAVGCMPNRPAAWHAFVLMPCADGGASPHPAVGAYFSLEDDEDNMQKRLVRSRQRSRAPSVATGPATLSAMLSSLRVSFDNPCVKVMTLHSIRGCQVHNFRLLQTSFH
jgi:hypothetical protein